MLNGVYEEGLKVVEREESDDETLNLEGEEGVIISSISSENEGGLE
jgi:hypothetical protein